MAESNGQEKTEQPTGKRRKDARKKGNVLQSKDIASVITLFGSFYILRLYLPVIYNNIKSYMIYMLSDSVALRPEALSSQTFFGLCITLLKCVLPILLAATLLAIAGVGVQTRFLVSFHLVKPNFGKLNPLRGIKNMFSLKNLVTLLENMLKCTLIGALLFSLIKADLIQVAKMIDMEPMNGAVYALKMIFELVLKVSLAFCVVAFFDFLYRRWEYEKDLKMTKQEVKDEYKQTEGNPEIKGRIRRIQRQMAMSRMMQKVPEADVIIRNPTHLAIALRYDPKRDGAPMVLAKGQDDVALRIVKTGEEHGVYVLENKALARALYPSCELDRPIPSEFYGAVAEILVFIYRETNREDMLRQ